MYDESRSHLCRQNPVKTSPSRRDALLPNQRQDGAAPQLPVQLALDSGALFAGGNEVVIAHGAETYRLRLTRQNRLILTK